MEEEKKLYPFRFCEIEDVYSWGKECFKLADLGYRDSLVRDGWLAGNSIGEIMDMYMDRVVGENVFEYYGRQFPIAVKTICVNGRMPLQVCPPDETAAQRYDFLGKDKLWYVVRAGKNAKVTVGFKRDSDAGEFYSKCTDGSVEELLNAVAPHRGQSFIIPAGTPHYASGDIEIVEVSESSPLDFCLCSWGEEVSGDEFDPALDMANALDFIGYEKYSGGDTVRFSVRALGDAGLVHKEEEHGDSFAVYACVSGKITVNMNLDGLNASFGAMAGDVLLVPAECPDWHLACTGEDASVLEITVPFRTVQDSYVNPNVPERPEED